MKEAPSSQENPWPGGRSQEDKAHSARLDRVQAEEEQVVMYAKKYETKNLKIHATGKDNLRQSPCFL